MARKSTMAHDPAIEIGVQRYWTIVIGLVIAKLCARRYARSWPCAISHHHTSRGTETVDHEHLPSAATDRIAGIFKIGDHAAIVVLDRARTIPAASQRARQVSMDHWVKLGA
jgi:hypothetical protein